MDRSIVYTQEQGRSTDFLFAQRAAMIGLAKLSAVAMGTSTMVNGLGCTPTSPASLQVLVGAGEIYAMTSVDATAYGTLPADTTDSILKQGIALASTTLNCPAPITAGYSINYLVQVAYQDSDTANVVPPYFNSANPSQPLSGQTNTGTPQPTQRQGAIAISVKAGAAATTGTQTTPAADAGYIGLYVVTVANGQTTVTAPNIVQLATAPIIPTGIIPAIQSGAYGYAVDTGTANTYHADYSPAIAALTDGMVLKFKATNANTGASTFFPSGLTSAPIWGSDHAALTGGEIVANGDVSLEWNSSLNGTGVWVILESTGGYRKGPTPPQFDASAKLVTAEFVQRVGLQSRGIVGLAAGANVLTVAHVGTTVAISGAIAASATLPLANSVPPGARIEFIHQSTGGACPIARAGADLIFVSSTNLTSLSMSDGDSLTLESNGSDSWLAVAGSAQLKYSPAAWALSFGVGQTWQNVTGSRVSGANYTNSTDKLICIELHATSAIATALSLSGSVAGNVGPYSYIPGLSGAATAATIYLFVPPGATYSATIAAASFVWNELR